MKKKKKNQGKEKKISSNCKYLYKHDISPNGRKIKKKWGLMVKWFKGDKSYKLMKEQKINLFTKWWKMDEMKEKKKQWQEKIDPFFDNHDIQKKNRK